MWWFFALLGVGVVGHGGAGLEVLLFVHVGILVL